MYLGILFMYSFIPLALGSYWGLLASAFLPVSLVLRILNEEEVLKKNLAGYNEYCTETRYRLIPYVW
jgi:protein-S-isoprenylcysteine O-methyltransferase Ste14